MTMGRHSNIGPHYYSDLDKKDDGYHDSAFRVSIPLREVAEKVDAMNYGIHRFLSHLVDVRREELAKRIKEYRDRGDEDVARFAEREGDRLADEIERLLHEGYY